MDDRSIAKLGLAVSLIWLLLMVARIAMFSSFYMDTPEGRLFSTALNVALVGGLALIAWIWGVPMYRRIRAAARSNGYCQQCYARMPSGEGFCPRCGWERRRSFSAGSAVRARNG